MSLRIGRLVRHWDMWLVVAIGAGLRFSRLGDFHNEYYTATVASMLKSLHNFLFASFDPGGVVMVDKPPFSFWIQAIPAALFGVNASSVTLPQAIAGTLAIIVLYLVIKQALGRLAALSAALILAVIPSSIVIDSRNEPDSLLSFALLLAALCIIRAAQTGKWRWLMAFALLMGIGFNTKMLVAFVPLPAFLLYYVVASNQRARQLAVRTTSALAVIAIVSLSWLMLVGLTSEEHRPYVGSTPDNSIATLVLKYNGINRFTSFIGPRPGPGLQAPQGTPYALPPTQQPQAPPGSQPLRPPTITPDVSDSGLVGLLGNPLAGQLGWLLPLGVFLLLVMLVPLVPEEVYKRPITAFGLLRTSPASAQIVLWGGWFATAIVVFGLADATTTHPYYLVGVAVPLAAVMGVGFASLWQSLRRGSITAWLLPAILLGTVFYQVSSARGQVADWTIAAALVTILGAFLLIVVGIWRRLTSTPLVTIAVAIGALSVLIIPLAFATTIGGRLVGPAGIPQRPPAAPQINAQEQRLGAISSFISQQGDVGSMFVVGAVNAREAAPFIIAGVPAVAIGGFSGNDPIFTLESFRAMVERGDLRYFLMSPAGSQGGPPGPSRQQDILSYIRRNWEDVSRAANLPPGSLYRYRGRPSIS